MDGYVFRPVIRGLDKAECVIVLPSVLKFAIGIGGSYGRGVMTCRGGDTFTGPWGAPSMIALEGGSFLLLAIWRVEWAPIACSASQVSAAPR